MGKLIFADSIANFKAKLPNWNVSTDPSYYSIAFTNDGYLLTHGKQFALTIVGEDVQDAVKLALSNDKTQLLLTGNNLQGSIVDLPVYSILGVTDNPVTVTEDSGKFTIQHEEVTGDTTGLTQYGNITADYKVTIPKLHIDSYGHVVKATNGTETAINLVKQELVTGTKFSLLGTTASATGTTSTVFNSNIYVQDNALYAESIFEGSILLGTKYVKASALGDGKGTNYFATGSLDGIVRLSDSITSDLNAAEGKTAATPLAVKNAVAQALNDAKALFASNDAMIFMGTIKANGTIVTHNTNVIALAGLSIINGTTKVNNLAKHETGWTFKFVEEGTFTFGSKSWIVESGDMLVCISSGNSTTAVYDVIQANIENQVIAGNATLPAGVVYATGIGRTIASLAYGTAGKALMSTGSGVEWGDVVNNWRPINVKGTEQLTNETTSGALNFSNGTGVDLSFTDGTITISNTSPLNAATDLLFKNGDNDLTSYNPKNEINPVLKFGGAIVQASLVDGVITVEHKTSGISAKTTQGLYKIAFDAYGHITGATAVASADLPASAYSFSASHGTNKVTYNNNVDSGIEFVSGTDTGWTSTVSNGVLTLTPIITHKYKTISFYNSGTSPVHTSSNTTDALDFKAGDNISFNYSDDKLNISAVNTWRNVEAINLTNLNDANSANDKPITVLANSISTSALKFGDEFVWDGDEIKLVWTEISGDTITYKT